MIKNGYTIFGIRPGSPDRILDRPAYSSLLELKEPVDIIDVFRSSDAIPDVVADIETWMKSFPSHQRPRLLWLQEGVTNPIAEEKAETLGLKVISNRCILKERVRLFGHAK
jgi:predicted CoA-binding protein